MITTTERNLSRLTITLDVVHDGGGLSAAERLAVDAAAFIDASGADVWGWQASAESIDEPMSQTGTAVLDELWYEMCLQEAEVALIHAEARELLARARRPVTIG